MREREGVVGVMGVIEGREGRHVMSVMLLHDETQHVHSNTHTYYAEICSTVLDLLRVLKGLLCGRLILYFTTRPSMVGCILGQWSVRVGWGGDRGRGV